MESEELFAKCYVDECFSPVLSDALGKLGFDAVHSNNCGASGLDDEQQLSMAISLKRILITRDKRSFLKDSNSIGREHYGVIVVAWKDVSLPKLNMLAKQVVEQYLNIYSSDEWKNLVVYL